MYLINYHEAEMVEGKYQKEFDALDVNADDYYRKYQELEARYKFALEQCICPRRMWREGEGY